MFKSTQEVTSTQQFRSTTNKTQNLKQTDLFIITTSYQLSACKKKSAVHVYLVLTPSSSSAFPATSKEYNFFGEIFAHVIVFRPAIQVLILPLRGWCMQGVFLLLAFTHLGHECQDFNSHPKE